MSFKYGDFEGERDGRLFLDMTEEKFRGILKSKDNCTLIEEWRSTDVRRGRDVSL